MAEADTVLTKTSLESLPRIAEGKVRDLYEVDSRTLLFVASDRVSAYDVIMGNGIPSKGALLTLLSVHWFNLLPKLIPDLRTHFLTLSLPSSIPESERAKFQNRSMQVRRLKIFPIEAIVRGYITGSAWKEYKRSGTVHKLPFVAGLKESEAFPHARYTHQARKQRLVKTMRISRLQKLPRLLAQNMPRGLKNSHSSCTRQREIMQQDEAS